MILDELRDAIKNKDVNKIRILERWNYLPEIIYHDGLEAGRFLLTTVDLKKVSYHYFLRHIFTNNTYGVDAISDAIRLLSEVYTINTIDIDSEVYHELMKHQGESLKFIETCTELNIKFRHLYCLYSSAHNENYDNFKYLTENYEFDEDTFEEFTKTLLSGGGRGYIDPEITQLINSLITKFNVDVNLSGLDNDFDYAIHQCLFGYPYAAKYFLTSQFDSSLLEDSDFWEEFCDLIDGYIKHYPIAFQQIKASGITFDDSIMLSALKSAGYDELINAYVNEPNGNN